MTRRFVDREKEFSAGQPAATGPHLLAVAWRRKLIIISSVVVCLAGGALLFSKITPTYSSVAKLHVRQSMPRMEVGQVTQIAPSFSVTTEFDIIKSTAVLEQALKVPALKAAKLVRAQSDPIAYLQSVLNVTAGRGEDIILISAETSDPDDAAVIVNGVAKAYTDYNAQQEKSSSAEMLKSLQIEKDRREAEYKQIKEDLLKLRRSNPEMLTADSSKGNLLTQQLSGLSINLAEAQMSTTNVRIISERLDELKDYPIPLRAFIASESAAMGFSSASFDDHTDHVRDQLTEKLHELESRYGPNHAEVVRVQNLLAEATPSDANSQYVDAFQLLTQQKLATAQRRESELRQQYEKIKDQTLSLNAQEQECAQLQNEQQRSEKLLDLLDSRMKELNVNGVTALMVSTLDSATANTTPVSPQRNKILGLALVAGLALGTSLAMVRDQLDQRLRSLEEIEDTLGTRILGTVPTLGKRVHPMLAGKTVEMRPISDVAEAYRSIRTSLFVTRSQNAPGKTILVTSAVSDEGKSTTTSNLAIATAQMGRRVLLVDADCRMPSLHVIFKINDGLDRGLSSILTNAATSEKAIRPTGIDKLDILTAGPLSSRPAELLNGKAFQTLLSNLSARYDHIFVDSPPVLPVTDARVLSTVCDMTILVLRAEKSTRKQTMRARDAIEGVGGKLLGVVVNDAPRRHAQYGCDFDVYPARLEDEAGVRRAKATGKRRAVQRAVPVLLNVDSTSEAPDRAGDSSNA